MRLQYTAKPLIYKAIYYLTIVTLYDTIQANQVTVGRSPNTNLRGVL